MYSVVHNSPSVKTWYRADTRHSLWPRYVFIDGGTISSFCSQFCHHIQVLFADYLLHILLKLFQSNIISIDWRDWNCFNFSKLFSVSLMVTRSKHASLKHTYLAWRSTVITKAVPLGWGLSIALRLGWPLRLPQTWVTRTRNFC